MCVSALRLLPVAVVATALLTACDPGAPTPRYPLEVFVPAAGVVQVDGEVAAADPLTPARFSLERPPPHTITFDGPAGPLTVVDAAGPTVDLRFFVDGAEPVRGTLIQLQVQAVGGDAEVVAVSEGTVFRPAADGGTLQFTVPDSPGLVFVALWRADGRATHVTRRAIARPELAVGRPVVIEPESALDGTLPVALDDGGRGVLTAELTEGGLRTGLMLGSGALGPGEAIGLPRTRDTELGVWIRIVDGAAGEAPRRITEAALPLAADGAALPWRAVPGVQPPARGADNPAWFDADARQWTLDDVDGASWIELTLDGRGDCVGRPWRFILPPAATVGVPFVDGLDPLRAPVVEARIDVVRTAGATLAELLAEGPSPRSQPGTLVSRQVAGVHGWWRTDPADCAIEERRGAYVVSGPDVACGADQPAVQAIVTRCGALAPLIDGAGTCGVFEGDLFVADDVGPLPVQIADEVLDVDQRFVMTPVPAADAAPPAAVVGDWARYELFRQPVDDQGRALAEPTRILAGADVVVATLGADGGVSIRTPLWAVDARLVSAMGEVGEAAVLTAECAARPAMLNLRWSADRVEIVGNAPDGEDGRRWTLVLQR